jgi:hypothetical protein
VFVAARRRGPGARRGDFREDPEAHGRYDAEQAAQAAPLRGVAGNPFRPMAVDPAWMSWQGGAVARLAQAAPAAYSPLAAVSSLGQPRD